MFFKLVRHYFRGFRPLALYRAPAERQTPTFFTSDVWFWTRQLLRIFKQQKPSTKNPAPKILDLDPPKFSRQRSQSFSGPLNTLFKARNLFVQNVLRRVTHRNARELRKRTAQELLSGNSAPFLALVGISLASGNGVLTKEDEIECVCKEVREAARKTKASISEDRPKSDESWSLKDFQIGRAISKGCSAVVYAAKCMKNGFEALGEDEYPLAMKMMFNFHAESNAQVILKAMQKETVIAENVSSLESLKPIVTPHPNIVKMYTAFPDYIPDLQGNSI